MGGSGGGLCGVCGGSSAAPGCAVQILQGYQKTYQLDLIFAATGEPYDLTGATQVKALHPGVLGLAATGPVVEYFSAAVATTTATTTLGLTTVAVLNPAGLTPGLNVAGAGIPASTTVTQVQGTAVTLSNAATATATGVTLTFTAAAANVTIVGAAGAGKIQVVIPAADSLSLRANPSPPQYQDLQVAVTNSLGTVDAFLFPAVLNIVQPTYGVL